MKQESPVQPGQVLAGKYRVDRVLGMGGMGVVVAATHLVLDEKVALKFLLPAILQHPEAVARFLREARAAVKIRSEHVARVSDVGTLENGAPYMVMEYLHGTDLHDRVAKAGVLSVQDAVDYVLQASEALAEAHSMGIVHRDLKPANLFLTMRPGGSPSVKVLDFGIAKMADGSGGSLTATGGVMGSAIYMSPEQLRSAKDVDQRTDVWALGVVLFELLTGHHPFMAESLGQLAVQILTEPPRSLRELRPDVPEPIVTAIESTLVKERTQRCADVGELAERLAPYGGPSAAQSLTRIRSILGAGPRTLPMTPDSPAPVLGTGTMPFAPQTTAGLASVARPTEDEPAAPRRSGSVRVGPLLFGLAAMVMIGGGAAYALTRERPTEAAAASATELGEAAKEQAKKAKSIDAEPLPPPSAASSQAPTPTVESSSSSKQSINKPPIKPKPAPSPSPKPLATAANCDPPYFYDSQGIKRFKPGCE